MTNFIFANNINTTLAGAVSTSATTITLASTVNLPASIPSGYVLVITLNDAATRNNYEVVYATSITGATLTVERAQEGTSALAWLVGDFAYSGPTAGQQQSFGQEGANNSWTGNNSFSSPVSIANAVVPADALALGQFMASGGSTGYVEFPVVISGTLVNLIINYGSGSITSSGSGVTGAAFTMAKAFSSTGLWSMGGFGGSFPPAGDSVAATLPNLTQIGITLYSQSAGSYAITWIAIGY